VNSTFGTYSSYYDLLYRDKDYAGETEYISRLLSDHSGGEATSLLELGCGTGIHACRLAAQGMVVHGVDASQSMLTAADARIAADSSLSRRVSFQLGDARSVRTGSRYDAVASLFHVVSYQTTNEDLSAMMTTAAEHLGRGGVFLFDFWYGPAVLWQRPSLRVKRLSDERFSITRLAEPAMREAANVVDVHYTVFIESVADASISKIVETHRMRYLFLPEVDHLLARHGFVRERAEEWLTGAAPSTHTWGVCVVARKV
jgi:SAM-dependent methyltransferase